MDELLDFSEIPHSEEMYMIAGWRQWADAGATSSSLPRYLAKHTKARKIGRIKSDSFYLFQLPGTHHFLRPEVKFKDGHRREIRLNRNEFWFTGNEKKGLIIFSGDEPHLCAERYADAFFNAAREFGVRRVVALGGVYAVVPYEKDRNVSCSYSLTSMKEELDSYAVRFSNYEGGVSIGSYMAHWAEVKEMEYVAMHAFVPMYDFSTLAPDLQGITVENDFKGWYDVMRRVNHMFGMELDLSDLEHQAERLLESINSQVDALEERAPQAHVREYLAKLAEDFVEMSFMPLDDVWNRELGDIFKDME